MRARLVVYRVASDIILKESERRDSIHSALVVKVGIHWSGMHLHKLRRHHTRKKKLDPTSKKERERERERKKAENTTLDIERDPPCNGCQLALDNLVLGRLTAVAASHVFQRRRMTRAAGAATIFFLSSPSPVRPGPTWSSSVLRLAV